MRKAPAGTAWLSLGRGRRGVVFQPDLRSATDTDGVVGVIWLNEHPPALIAAAEAHAYLTGGASQGVVGCVFDYRRIDDPFLSGSPLRVEMLDGTVR